MVSERFNLFKDKHQIIKSVTVGINIFLILFLLSLLSNNILIAESSLIFVISFYVLIAFILFNLPIQRIDDIITGKIRITFSKKLLLGFVFILFSFLILFLTRLGGDYNV